MRSLEEEFREKLQGHLSDEKTEIDVRIAVKIADEFAIGFAEWAITKNMGVNKFTLYEGELEIYKKEKGL